MNIKNIKLFKNKSLSIFHQLLIGFTLITIFVTILTGVISYDYTSGIIKESILKQVKHNLAQSISFFEKTYAAPLQSNLYMLESSAEINNLMTANFNEGLFYVPALERSFLRLTSFNPNYLMVSFIASNGQEKAKVTKDKRIKKYRSVTGSSLNDLYYKNLGKLFAKLKAYPTHNIMYEGPFKYENQWVVLVGISKHEPDIGGFGGVVTILCSLTDYIEYLSKIMIANRSLTWLIDEHYNILFQPLDYPIISNKRNFPENTYIFYEKCILTSDMSSLMTVVFAAPPEIFKEQLTKSIWITLCIGIGVTAVAIFLSFMISKRMSRPIKSLVEASTAISNGNFQIQVPENAGGEIGLLSETFKNMSCNLKRTTVTKNYMDNIINSMNDALIVTSIDGLIKTVNIAACELLYYEEEELLGKTVKNIIKTNRFFEPEWVSELLDKEHFNNLETVFITKHKNGIPVMLSISIMQYVGEFHNIIIVAQDISLRKKTEEKILTSARKLENSNMELERFVFVASQNFQDPLRKINTFCGLMQSKCSESLSEDAINYLNKINNSVSKMRALLDDITRYSKILSAERQTELVDLHDILNKVVTNMKSFIIQKEGHVEIGSMPKLEGNPQLIFILFENLIENGIKFHKEKVKPVVKINSTIINVSGVDYCSIKIEDNGVGFEQDFSERIFSVFQRFHSNNDYLGNGIGLAICNKIIEYHNGSISTQSKRGDGTTFTLNLPLPQNNENQNDLSQFPKNVA